MNVIKITAHLKGIRGDRVVYTVYEGLNRGVSGELSFPLGSLKPEKVEIEIKK